MRHSMRVSALQLMRQYAPVGEDLVMDLQKPLLFLQQAPVMVLPVGVVEEGTIVEEEEEGYLLMVVEVHQLMERERKEMEGHIPKEVDLPALDILLLQVEDLLAQDILLL